MNNISIYDELDQAIEKMMATPDVAGEAGADVRELVQVARDLRELPRENFKSRLQLELEWEAAGRAVTTEAEQRGRSKNTEVVPSLFGKNWSGYPVRRSNFALSAALHALMVLAVGAGLVVVKSMGPQIDKHVNISSHLEPYVFPIGKDESHGGGSGGAADKMPASHGVLPRASREQLASPVVLENNMARKLALEQTVIASPELNAMKMRPAGDPISLLAAPSNGPGVHGGLGGHSGTGVGTGDGPGIGSGRNGGCCDGVYTTGNGVSMPRPIYTPEPEFSEEARRIKLQGEVTLLATIGVDGRPRNLLVVRSLGMGLDEKAVAAVNTWRFEPAKKEGHPVAVQMNIIVNFHLY
jgi:periplasmic protein TonB